MRNQLSVGECKLSTSAYLCMSPRKSYWQQTDRMGFTAGVLFIPEMPTMEVYENVMNTSLTKLKMEYLQSILQIFFLEDLRR
jgi:hypothetical protein